MLVSALAGGGLTAVSMGGSLSDEAVAASSEHTGTVPLTVTESGAGSTGTAASGSTGATGSGSTGTTGAGSTGTTASGSQQSGTGHTTTTTPELGTPTRPIVVAPAPRRSSPSPQSPAVTVQRKQKNTPATPATPRGSSTTAKKPAAGASGPKGSNVALPPQLVAAQAGVLAAELAGSAASVQALAYYRIPLFLLPIYQAAAAQYGVPWQILAAINEIETDYGNDLSVSTAGAVGWMQFMPAT